MSVTLHTDITKVRLQGFPVADATLLNPATANAFQQGEWVTLNSSGQAVRVSNKTASQAYLIWSRLNDPSTRALDRLVTLFEPGYVASLDLFEDTTYAVGDRLTLNAVSIDGVTRSVITKAAQGTDVVYGTVLATPAQNNGKLKIKTCQPYPWPTA